MKLSTTPKTDSCIPSGERLGGDAIARIERNALLREIFDRAAAEALLDRKIVAAGVQFSVAFLEGAAVRGDGPTMTKMGRRVLYLKQDVVDWLARKSRRIGSTSQL